MKKPFNIYLGRILINSLQIALQLCIIIGGGVFLCLIFKPLYLLVYLFSLFTAFKIAVRRCNIPCRLGWIIGVLAMPIVFLPVYYLYGNGRIINKIERYMNFNPLQLKQSDKFNAPPHISKQFSGFSKLSGFPVYNNSKCQYLPTGQDFFETLKKDMQTAKKFIFLEFFIINSGQMWEETLEILKKKAKQGVKIYLLFDDMGTITHLPHTFKKQMKSFGINARNFNAFNGLLTPAINYRDHRKIAVIDGKVGYTGGANISDEYINLTHPFGYWKDTAVRVEGDAVNTFTAMFVQMWNLDRVQLDYADFITDNDEDYVDSIVMPFGDYPMCDIGYTEKVFLNLINNAQKTIDITTPYLVPDSRLTSALCLAAENGVRVRLFTPQIPDKKYVHIVTRANYIPLLKSNVEIYEFQGGFIHSKSVICDNEIAYIGSTNLDYRSLYIHFESGVLTCNSEAVEQLADDIESILKRSEKISPDDTKIIKADKNIFYKVLRIFSGIL